jgi:hypothetical protein
MGFTNADGPDPPPLSIPRVIRLWHMLGEVDFFQNYEILLFLHDSRAVSLDETDRCTVLSLLLTSLRLSGSTVGPVSAAKGLAGSASAARAG